MTTHPKPATLGQLKETGYQPSSVKDELRRNVIRKLKAGEELFPGIVGYRDSVIPQIVNGILSKHDLLFLGLRGQAKTRILRMLPDLLDEWMPVLSGTEIADDPLRPTTKTGKRLIAEQGDDAKIEWVHRSARYHEKLATPDVTIADLIGEIDLVKYAEGRYLSDESTMHFGLIPRSNRGLFAINELPDLAPRIQVGLFNILEERDLQIRGFPVRIPLDILMCFSANPEDYTNRGSIITPLKDRISSQILTHYPPDATIAADITRQEAWTEREADSVVIPEDVRLLVEEISLAARESDLVDQSSGVSARVAISALELLASNLERRALATQDNPIYPRLADLHMLLPAITGKVEMVYEGEQQGAEVVARRLIGQAVKKVFDARFPEVGKESGSGGEDDKGPYARIIRWFAEGNAVTISDEQPFADYETEIYRVPGLKELVSRNGKTREERALAAEMVLEGLHQHLKLARQDLDSQISYKEMVKFQLLKPRRGPGGRDRGDVN